MQPIYRIAKIELLETPVVLRMPFRFGIVTLRRCFQAFVRVRIETSDGKSSWGATAEMIAPKWFDKNPNMMLLTIRFSSGVVRMAERSSATSSAFLYCSLPSREAK